MDEPRVLKPTRTRDGRAFTVREADPADAPQIVAHSRSVLAEPQWNITELDEFQVSIESEAEWVRGFRRRPHNLLLVADVGEPGKPHIVGLASFMTQQRLRMRHRGRVGIGVQAGYRGVGVGEALLRALLDWATGEPEIERVELSVFAHNGRAMSLYLKLGFVEEARLRRAFKLADGSYYDDVMMVKWVKATPIDPGLT